MFLGERTPQAAPCERMCQPPSWKQALTEAERAEAGVGATNS